MSLSFDSAVSRYQRAVGNGAMQPARAASACIAGTWHLRNVRGALAIVTPHGVVMDRIGGKRLGTEFQGLRPASFTQPRRQPAGEAPKGDISGHMQLRTEP